jgi:hypothetical protein
VVAVVGRYMCTVVDDNVEEQISGLPTKFKPKLIWIMAVYNVYDKSNTPRP